MITYRQNGIDNKGSAVIEAVMILPLFIFAMLVIYHMGQSRLAECEIYEAAAETIEYMAEYSYLGECNLLIPEIKFSGYVDSDERIERYISGGADGVNFFGTVMLDDEQYVNLKVNYELIISLPFMPELTVERSINIKQKAYVGDDDGQENEDGNTSDMYVYVTDNREAYHMTRNCTHLRLSISITSMEDAQNQGYTACSFCGNGDSERVYITNEGNRYHCDVYCSGLKRTVYRIKLSEAGGIGGCERCVGY